MPETFSEFTCRGCALLCDDLTITWERDPSGAVRLQQCEPACSAARNWIEQGLSGFGDGYGDEPTAHSWRASVDLARSWLTEASAPLVWGLQGLSLETEALTVQVAEHYQARLSTTQSAEKTLLKERHGGASCTFGEVRHRADLILCGQCDLFADWPRFEERFWQLSGRFMPQPDSRRCLFLGESALLKNPEQYEVIEVPADLLSEAIVVLRRFLREIPRRDVTASAAADTTPYATQTSCSPPSSTLSAEVIAQLQQLAHDLKQAQYPVLFSGSGPEGVATQWTRLVNDAWQVGHLRQISCSAGPASGQPQQTLLAMTGFPDGVQFSEQEVNYDLASHSASTQHISEQEPQTILFLGAIPSASWRERLKTLPAACRLILIQEAGQPPFQRLEGETLVLTTSVAGLHDAGTMLRADGVPLPLRPVWQSATEQETCRGLPSLRTILQHLLEPGAEI